MHVVRGHGYVSARITSITPEYLVIVIAETSRMDLHDQSIVQTHARHLRQHLRPEELTLGRVRISRSYLLKKFGGRIRAEIGSGRCGMAMVSSSAAQGLELQASFS